MSRYDARFDRIEARVGGLEEKLEMIEEKMEERSDEMDGWRKETEEMIIRIRGDKKLAIGAVNNLEQDEDVEGEKALSARESWGKQAFLAFYGESFSACILLDP